MVLRTSTSAATQLSSLESTHDSELSPLHPNYSQFYNAEPIFGRTEELEKIVEVARSRVEHRKPFTVIVSGSGGYGKTKLAFSAWNHLIALYPGPKMHVRLRGRRGIETTENLVTELLSCIDPSFPMDSPLEVGSEASDVASRTFSEEDSYLMSNQDESASTQNGKDHESESALHGGLGASSASSSSFAEKLATYQGILQKKALILVDHIHDLESIRPLLPTHGSNSAILITTREDPEIIPFTLAIKLDVLGENAALEYLKWRAPEASEDICRLALSKIQLLPSLISVVGRIVEVLSLIDSGRSPEGLIGGIVNPSEWTTSEEFLMHTPISEMLTIADCEVLAKCLDEESLRVLAFASRFAAPFLFDHIRHILTEYDEDDLRIIFQSLLDLSLLDGNEDLGRYFVRDSVRSLLSRLTTSHIDEIRYRVFRYWMSRLQELECAHLYGVDYLRGLNTHHYVDLSSVSVIDELTIEAGHYEALVKYLSSSSESSYAANLVSDVASVFYILQLRYTSADLDSLCLQGLEVLRKRRRIRDRNRFGKIARFAAVLEESSSITPTMSPRSSPISSPSTRMFDSDPTELPGDSISSVNVSPPNAANPTEGEISHSFSSEFDGQQEITSSGEGFLGTDSIAGSLHASEKLDPVGSSSSHTGSSSGPGSLMDALLSLLASLQYASLLRCCGWVYHYQQDPEMAVAFLRRSIHLLEFVLSGQRSLTPSDRDSSIPIPGPSGLFDCPYLRDPTLHLIFAHLNLAYAYIELPHRITDAEREVELADQLVIKHFSQSHSAFGMVQAAFGAVLRARTLIEGPAEHLVSRGSKCFLQAISCREAIAGPFDSELSFYKGNYALLMDCAGNLELAESLFLDSLSIMEQTIGLESPNGCRSLENIAYFYQHKGDIPIMMTYLRRALFMFRKVYGSKFRKVDEIRDILFALLPEHTLLVDEFCVKHAELKKYRGSFKSWKPRVLILDGLLHVIIVYKEEEKEAPKYIISLKDILRVESADDKGKLHCFAIRTQDTAHIFTCDDEEEKEKWLVAINEVMYASEL